MPRYTTDGRATNANSFLSSAESPFVLGTTLTTSVGDGCADPSESEQVRKCMQHKFYIASIQRPGLSTHICNWKFRMNEYGTRQQYTEVCVPLYMYVVEEITNKSRVKQQLKLFNPLDIFHFHYFDHMHQFIYIHTCVCVLIYIYYTYVFTYTYGYIFIHIYLENWTRPTVVKHFKDGIPGIFYILPMPESSVTNQRLI